MTTDTRSIAIIGAGMAGLACADQLAARGMTVTLFDKGRGPGGRMSTRRAETPLGQTAFDHGAQYMTARDPRFQQQIAAWESANVAARWPQAGNDAYVGTPGMNAPVKAMAGAHEVHWATRISSLKRHANRWMLASEEGQSHGPYDAAIIAVPAEQVPDLVRAHHSNFANAAAAIESAPCWTVMLAFDAPLAGLPDTIRPNTNNNPSPIGWAARNNAKPGRANIESWVVQANPAWSAAHLEDDKETVITAMQHALAETGDTTLPEPIMAQAHRWRYAMVPKRDDNAAPYLWDAETKIGLCGDWLSGPRIENAWASGHALGKAV